MSKLLAKLTTRFFDNNNLHPDVHELRTDLGAGVTNAEEFHPTDRGAVHAIGIHGV